MKRGIGGETEGHPNVGRTKSFSDNETVNTPVTPKGSYERFLELTGDGFLIVQKETIMELNRAMADMCGYSIKALIGRSLSLLTGNGPTDLSQLAATIHNDDTATIKDRPLLLRRYDGSAFPVKINATRVDYNMVSAVLFLVRDISKSIEAEDELQRARQLESIAALSGGIAHDYNNLLTVIIGNVSLIQSYVDPQDMVYRLLNEVNEAALVAKSLTQKLITFSRGGAPLKETTDMAALVRSVAEFSLSGSNIKCQFDVADDLWLVDVDKTQVSQAVHNLVMNAREAMPEGGVITVSAGNVQNIDGEHVSTAVRWVRLSIIDRGQGIAPENMDRIFNPYFSTKQRGNQKGTGLGLSICHSIIRKHDGKVLVDSSPGLGTTVNLYLPASVKTLPAISAAKPCKASTPIPGCGRILVMDDEEMIINMAGRILGRLGYETEFARNGSEAVAFYEEALKADQPFDAVVLDLTVRGGMGGEEAMRHLLTIDPQVKAIVSSGYSDSPVMQDYKQYGFSGAAGKPYSLFELSQSLARVLNQATAL
ncbi:MAG: ATP-binding protein [Desulfobacterales bacterium]